MAGVDGCRRGWVVVEWSGRDLMAHLARDMTALVGRLRAGELDAVAVDMPIGLLDHQPRICDTEARKLLGRRRSSIFPTPVRAVLAAADYDEACRLSRAASGKALSKQAYNLLPKMAELDRLVQPADQARLVEAHPECAFARLAGQPLEEPKRTVEGRAIRRRLLRRFHPAFDDLLASDHGLPVLDLIDASVLAITARRLLDGSAHRLGSDLDRRGLRAEIVF